MSLVHQECPPLLQTFVQHLRLELLIVLVETCKCQEVRRKEDEGKSEKMSKQECNVAGGSSLSLLNVKQIIHLLRLRDFIMLSAINTGNISETRKRTRSMNTETLQLR